MKLVTTGNHVGTSSQSSSGIFLHFFQIKITVGCEIVAEDQSIIFVGHASVVLGKGQGLLCYIGCCCDCDAGQGPVYTERSFTCVQNKKKLTTELYMDVPFFKFQQKKICPRNFNYNLFSTYCRGILKWQLFY